MNYGYKTIFAHYHEFQNKKISMETFE